MPMENMPAVLAGVTRVLAQSLSSTAVFLVLHFPWSLYPASLGTTHFSPQLNLPFIHQEINIKSQASV